MFCHGQHSLEMLIVPQTLFDWYIALSVQQACQPRLYTTPKNFLKLNQQLKFKSETNLQTDLPCSSVSLHRNKKLMNQKHLHFWDMAFPESCSELPTANITEWFLIVFILQSWDPDLAKLAKAWARKCLFKHNIHLKERGKVHPRFASAGENIWTGSLPVFTVKAALNSWYHEVESYDYDTNRCSKVCGHYTQVGIAFLHLNHEPALPFWYKTSTFLMKIQWMFPGSVILLYVCVHNIFLWSKLLEEKSYCIITLNVAVCGVFGKKTVQLSSSQISQAMAKKGNSSGCGLQCMSGMRSQLCQVYFKCQGLEKYHHEKRYLQFCKHHICTLFNCYSQRKQAKGGKRLQLPCNPAVTAHSCMKAGQLATATLGLNFDPRLFNIFCRDTHVHLGLEWTR